jgi:triphosphoribosyl-dephospho-CoA synthase
MFSASEASLQEAFLAACRGELEALKPGNVHIHSEGHGMSVADFLRSAEAAAAPLCRSGIGVGRRIRDAVEASWNIVPMNTNLGILLLASPLVAAAELPGGSLLDRVEQILAALTIEDARHAFAAIARANPAGLGHVEAEDVASQPTVTLRQAMALAADRDLIARQYASSYHEVFAVGVARIMECRWRHEAPSWATTLSYLDFLGDFPDSHIARKFGSGTAETVRREAAELRRRLPADREKAFAALLEFDRALKARGLNPGTSADLTVASLLAAALDAKV